jgi:hypothetical protein
VDGSLSRSDRALYRAKERRGGYVFALDLPQVSSPGLAPAAEAVAASTGQWAA